MSTNMADQVGELDQFLAVAKDCGIVLYLNQSQQSISPCFGQSANHGARRPYSLASVGGYHLRRPLLTQCTVPFGVSETVHKK